MSSNLWVAYFDANGTLASDHPLIVADRDWTIERDFHGMLDGIPGTNPRYRFSRLLVARHDLLFCVNTRSLRRTTALHPDQILDLITAEIADDPTADMLRHLVIQEMELAKAKGYSLLLARD